MSEQPKQKSIPIADKVKKYKMIEAALAEMKAEILEELAGQYNPNAKEQIWGKAFSYTPVGSVVDEPAVITQYCLENKEAEDLYMTIQERKAQNKMTEDELVQRALVWHSEQKKAIPRKPRAASFRLNKGGMQ